MKFTIDGHEILFDDEDVMLLFNRRWQVTKRGRSLYAISSSNRLHGSTEYMHRVLMNPGDRCVDHINGNGLDNRRSNLRLCSRPQNQMNMRAQIGKNTKGVSKDRRPLSKRWLAQIQVSRKNHFLGRFRTRREALAAYDAAAKKHFGEFANLNNKEKL